MRASHSGEAKLLLTAIHCLLTFTLLYKKAMIQGYMSLQSHAPHQMYQTTTANLHNTQ